MTKLIGLGLMVIGVYFLGDNVIFTHRRSYYWYTDIAADGCVISMLAGLLLLFFGGATYKIFGFVLIGLSIALVFVSGYVVLERTTLWEFFLSFMCMAGGYKLMTTGRIDI